MRKGSAEILGNVVAHKKGFAFKSEWFEDSGVPVVKVTNFTESSVNTSDLDYVNETIAEEKKAYSLSKGDVVIQTVGSWPNNPASVVGKVIKVPKELEGALLNQNAVVLYPSAKVHKGYLFFLLKDRSFKGYIINTAQGAANQASITLDSIFRFQFYLPDFGIQKKIAAILTTYDDLIENNKRRIVLLEKMAEEIYREWFVRMRFPAHERTKFEKGVPEGWEASKLGNVADLTMGQSPKSEFYNEIGEGLPFNQGVGTYGERFPRKITFCTSPGRKAKKGDILFSVRAPVGRLNIADCEMIIGRGLASIRHKDNRNSYLFYLLRTSFSNEDIIGNGAIFNSVGKDELMGVNILRPDSELIANFDELASKIDQKIALLFEALEKLTSSRNLLLSRLISGKLPVENLDIQFPPGMMDETEGEATTAPAKEDTDAKPHHGRRHRAGNTKEAKA